LAITLKAFILINTHSGSLWKVAEEALKIQNVKMAIPVTGEFEVIALAEFVKIEDLQRVINSFQSLKGVVKTQTCIAIPYPVRN
jgi:hypothetical protein